MNVQQLQQLGEAVGVVLFAGGAWWNARRADRQTRETGNGWARQVMDSLRRIEDKVDTHLADHARADVSRGPGAARRAPRKADGTPL